MNDLLVATGSCDRNVKEIRPLDRDNCLPLITAILHLAKGANKLSLSLSLSITNVRMDHY